MMNSLSRAIPADFVESHMMDLTNENYGQSSSELLIKTQQNFDAIIGQPCSAFVISQLKGINHSTEVFEKDQIVVVRDANFILRYAKVLKGLGIGIEPRFKHLARDLGSNPDIQTHHLCVNDYQVQISLDKIVRISASSLYSLEKIPNKYKVIGTEKEQEEQIEKARGFVSKPFFALDEKEWEFCSKLQAFVKLNQIVLFPLDPNFDGSHYGYGMVIGNLGTHVGGRRDLYEIEVAIHNDYPIRLFRTIQELGYDGAVYPELFSTD